MHPWMPQIIAMNFLNETTITMDVIRAVALQELFHQLLVKILPTSRNPVAAHILVLDLPHETEAARINPEDMEGT